MTQKQKVLWYMQENGCITTRDAGIKLNVWDLQAIIYALKADDFQIYDEWVISKNKNNYKIYSLKEKNLKAYKDRLGKQLVR